MTLTAARTPIRYALLSGLDLYYAPLGDVADPRAARVTYTRDAADIIAATTPGYTVVPVKIGHFRCFDCNGHGEWETGPGDWTVCSRCDGHGWVNRKGKS